MKIEQRITETTKLAAGELSESSRAAWEEVGNHFIRHILPKHFTAEGAREYHYRRRSPEYEARKQEEQGHRTPLVFTGQLKRQVLSSSTVEVSAKNPARPKVKVRISAPNYMRSRSSKGAELRRVSRGDKAELAAVLDRVLTDLLAGESPAKEVRQ